ncbi:hypothetical protein CRYUN_Cryun03dG0108200 [Craigia yunnanensis]
MIHNERSLCSRVFKGKHFPNNSFIEAKLGYNPSFVWRSLLERRKVIERGSIWRIGNGSKVHIWQHMWIPKPPTFKPSLIPGQDNEMMFVSELIDHTIRTWNEEFLHYCFFPEDANLIKNIALSRRVIEDKLIWSSEC